MIFTTRLANKKGLTRKQAMKMTKDRFADKRAVAATLMAKMDRTKTELAWNLNVLTFYDKDGGNTFHFDMGFRSDKELIYHLIAENGPENYPFETFTEIFPKQSKDNMVILKDCSHFLQDEKP